MIRAILLDLGGPVFNEDAEYQRWTDFLVAALEREGIEVSNDRFWAVVKEEIARCEENPWLSALWRFVRPDLGLFRRIREAFRESQRAFLHDLPGVFVRSEAKEAIPKLAEGYILALAGNQPVSALRILEEASLLRYFQWQEVSEGMGVAKPNPLFFRMILDSLGLAPEEAVMVGDRLDHDVLPARLLGMRAVRVLLGPYSLQFPPSPLHMPHVSISDLSALEGTLSNIGEG